MKTITLGELLRDLRRLPDEQIFVNADGCAIWGFSAAASGEKALEPWLMQIPHWTAKDTRQKVRKALNRPYRAPGGEQFIATADTPVLGLTPKEQTDD